MMRTARVGESVWTPSGQTVVVDECTIALGAWACASHRLVHANNLSASLHEDGPGEHVAYWLCPKHGPEPDGRTP